MNEVINPRLKFSIYEINELAKRYEYAISETGVMNLKDKVKQQGYLVKDDLLKITYWKSPRSSGHAKKNTEEYVSEIMRFIFSTNCERARIETLTVLDGVSWPTASAILHLCHFDSYPILDYRALWSLSIEVTTQYDFNLWWSYVIFCRSLSVRANVSMRVLDKALWQYSKENQ